MTFTANGLEALILGQLSTYAWPFFRITGLLMIAPVFGTRLVPARVKIALAVALTAAIAPAVEAPQDAGFSVASALIAAHELLLGIVLGFVLQLLFDALVIAGQTIAMTMGLGFATMVDPQRGVSVPLLSQFFVILGILVFLALDGHLALLALLAESYELMPIGVPLGRDSVWSLVVEGGEMFAGALRLALPAVTALLVVNLAFGVMSRAAPTLNLFAVGFPTALLLGLVFLLLDIGGVVNVFSALVDDAFVRLGAWLAG
jgi:flagellar biosynthetic protein FliR